jgi:hypothetical protein
MEATVSTTDLTDTEVLTVEVAGHPSNQPQRWLRRCSAMASNGPARKD